MGRREIAAVCVALALGVGTGGLVEHQRALDDSNAAPAATTPTTAPAAISVWFDNNTSAACPPLQAWYGALGRAVFFILAGNLSWDSIRAELGKAQQDARAAYQSLVPIANPAGKAELEFLLTALDESAALTKRSTSAGGLLSAQSKLNSERLGRDIDSMLQGAQSCT